MKLQTRLTIGITALFLFLTSIITLINCQRISSTMMNQSEMNGTLLSAILSQNIALAEHIPNEVEKAIGEQMLAQATIAAELVGTLNNQQIDAIFSKALKPIKSELNFTDKDGNHVFKTPLTAPDLIFGEDKAKHGYMSEFWPLLKGEVEFINQEEHTRVIDGEPFKYVAVKGKDQPRIVQIGTNVRWIESLRQRVGFENIVHSIIKSGTVNAIWVLDRKTNILAFESITTKFISSTPSEYNLDLVEKVLKNNTPQVQYEKNEINIIRPINNQEGKLIGATIVQLPMDRMYEELKEQIKISILIAIAALGLGSAFTYWYAKKISNPIRNLALEAKKIQKLELDDTNLDDVKIEEVDYLNQSISAMKSSLLLFARYVPRELVFNLMQSEKEIKLGGTARKVTIFFSDIAGFTSVSEKMTAEDLMLHLSEYFQFLTSIIISQKGTIDKFIGDAIMAFWGAPLDDKNHAMHACRAALLCQKSITNLNKRWSKEGKPLLKTRIGLNTGEVVIGNVGSLDRMNYTAIGDDVNLASRLEGVNKTYGTQIIISESVKNEINGAFVTRMIDIVAVKGKEKGVKIYELVGQIGDSILDTHETMVNFCSEFEKGVQYYLSRDWNKARKVFHNLKNPENPDDPTMNLYLERCDYLEKNPPSENWDGVVHLDHK
jgi:class 3 adenylate cyclase